MFSENGIIAKAREAAEKTNQAVINEQAQMNDLAATMENMLNGIGGSTAPDEPTENIDPETGWDLNKVVKVPSKDETPIIVPVPKGYTASDVTGENTVENGFVIYEGEKSINDESDIEEARETRNQFVWVPVLDVSEMYGTDINGKKWGKLYNFSASGITPLNWTENDGVMTILNATSYREPDVVPDETLGDTNTRIAEMGLEGVTTVNEFKTYLELEFSNIIESVSIYGGFYIGRYETGNLSKTEVSVIKNNSDIEGQTWYTMYNKSKGIAANSNVTTSMIWGCQWDAVMRWMYNSGDEEKKTYTYNSTGKGNYSGTNGNKTIPTGSNNAYSVNNIYDMAGNVYDQTVEADGNYKRDNRGGRYGTSNGVTEASSSRFSNNTGAGSTQRFSCYSLYKYIKKDKNIGIVQNFV